MKQKTYLCIQIFTGRGRCVGIGADGGAGVNIIGAKVVYGVTDPTADRAAVIPAGERSTQFKPNTWAPKEPKHKKVQNGKYYSYRLYPI